MADLTVNQGIVANFEKNPCFGDRAFRKKLPVSGEVPLECHCPHQDTNLQPGVATTGFMNFFQEGL